MAIPLKKSNPIDSIEMELFGRPIDYSTGWEAPYGSIRAAFMEITPETASKWLEKNTSNFRARSDMYERQISLDVINGDFDINGESIKFDCTGRLADGQTRLWGCVSAGKPIISLVVWGIPRDDNIDMGRKRSLAQILANRGEKDAKTLAGALRRLFMAERSWKDAWSNQRNATQTSNEILLRTLESHPGIRQSVQFVARKCSKLGIFGSTGSAWHYFAAKKDAQMATAFWDSLDSGGENLRSTDPVWMLIRLLERSMKTQTYTLDAHTQIGLMSKAWNHWRTGTTTGCLKFSSSGKGAEDIPELV